MMISRGLFGWSPPHIQPLTPVSEVSEPPESPSPYLDTNTEGVQVEDEEEIEEPEEMEMPPAAVPFSRLFACADGFDWVLMVVGSLAAAAHGTALVVYLHFFGKVIQLLSLHHPGVGKPEMIFEKFTQHALYIIYIAVGVFAAGWIEVSCWILTGERQTAVIRSKYVQVLLNQDMSFFDTYGNNGDIVSQVLSDVLLIQSALSEKVGNYIHNMATFFSGLVIGLINCWQIALITLATGPFIVAAGGVSNIFLHRLAENIQDAYAEAASIAEQAISSIRTLSAFTNETLAKYSYATSLQATLRYGILISLVQGLGLGFTYGLAICSCALQLWVGRFLVAHDKAHGGEILTALFAVILSGLGLNQAATNFYSFEQGRIAAYRLFEMISRSTSAVNQDGNTLVSVQGNIEFRNVYFSYLSRPEIPILSGFYLTVPARKTVALVGRNGSGKSSIIPLMERFYDPTLGEVLLDGENIKSLKLEWLNSVTMAGRYGQSYREGNGYGNFGRSGDEFRQPGQDGSYFGDRSSPQPPQPRTAPAASPSTVRNMPSRPQMQEPGSAEEQITHVLEHIKSEWPIMCQEDCVPVQLSLQLLDSSSVGRAHDYRKFQNTHTYVQDSLKRIVHEHHQGFNSSIGTFHKIQGSIQASQKRVRALKESLANSKTNLCSTDLELKKLSKSSQEHDELLQLLNELDELRAVPDQLEARISEKRFLTAVEVLQSALRKLRKPELDDIGALSELRSYLSNQETALMDILVEELHEHLYLKSPYCQERWQNLAKAQGAYNENYNEVNSITPFHTILDTIDSDKAISEDPTKNPEADTFYYVTLLVESLNKLGRLQNAVETLKQRLPVELFGVVNETINEVDQRHPSSLRGGSTRSDGLHVYGTRETQMRADVIYDLLWTLYGKFEAIGEGHRIFHESIKVLIRREGAGNNSALLGSFKELWNLYQNEIRSLLHNYVTTEADVYQFDSPTPGNSFGGKKDGREHLFKLSEADSKSTFISTEHEAIDNIIQAAVPGLGSRKSDKKHRAPTDGQRGEHSRYGNNQQTPGSYKSLVEPSVFNMSLLLPPTLVFLQRLKGIVPPGSDLAASTLTTFLDNFLVNVFQPQLDETLAKLSDTVFGEADAFTQDSAWNQISRRPVFRGTTAFFEVVTAFCRMLGTIPPDQALSSLMVGQMMRYYDRCFNWYKSLVIQAQEQVVDPANANLRASARFSLNPGDLQNTMMKLWTADEMDWELAEREVRQLIDLTNESPLEAKDIIQDRDSISSLCLLYTSMKWLAVKIAGLRHITMHDTDTSRQNLPRHSNRRWTLLNDPNKVAGEGPVQLPLTQESVQSFDSIVSSFEELAGTALLTLHMEVRCRIVQSLRIVLSPTVAPYLLDQDVNEPDPQILSLNSELVLFDETVVRYLRESEISFIRTGLGLLVNCFLVSNANLASPMNAKGCGRMQLNILVLQQNLKNVEEGVDLARAANYFSLFDKGADAIVEKARQDKELQLGNNCRDAEHFSYDELKALMELCYSEQLANPERGISSAAKRQMADKLLGLSEHMWQT